MASLFKRSQLQLMDLRDLPPGQLSELLVEEGREWLDHYHWDFRASAALIERFAQLRSLNGYGLLSNGYLAGYGYYVADEGKGLIGDFYVRPSYRTEENENLLLDAILTALWRVPSVRRIEAQPLTIADPYHRRLPEEKWLQRHDRLFLDAPLPLRELGHSSPHLVSAWTPSFEDAAARLIAHCYRGHVDAEINDQYRSVFGAGGFLVNLIQYPGCGEFVASASFVMRRPMSGDLIGLSMASRIAERSGHITQLCVAPESRRQGIGLRLLHESADALARAGCTTISLTVTTANRDALEFYRSAGFHTLREFSAYVWSKP